jgi:hypothetical protein
MANLIPDFAVLFIFVVGVCVGYWLRADRVVGPIAAENWNAIVCPICHKAAGAKLWATAGRTTFSVQCRKCNGLLAQPTITPMPVSDPSL